MDTLKFLVKLSNRTTKTDYLQFVHSELTQVIRHFTNLGYTVNAKQGFVGAQTLKNQQDIIDSIYFRDILFIHKGLHGSWHIANKNEELYFKGIEGFVMAQYNFLP